MGSDKMMERFSVGDKIRLKTVSGIQKEGTVMPSDEEDEKIVLKLENGYNIGFSLESIEDINLIEEKTDEEKDRTVEEPDTDEDLKDVLVLHTGGTIASRVSYEEGGVKPGFSVEDLREMYPEIFETANISSEIISQMFSEDMEPGHWQEIARKVYEKIEDFDGVVVSHGTDTMQFTASALSFMLRGVRKPVVFVGSQRSSDRPSSDSALNLKAAIKFIESQTPGVYVCMHKSSDDEKASVHRGTRVRKMHTSRRDAFESIREKPLAIVDLERDEVDLREDVEVEKEEMELMDRIEENVGFLKSVPGMEEDCLDRFSDREGLVIEGTGLGHLPVNSFDSRTEHHEKILESLEDLCEDTLVCMTSQCINGKVNLDVYDSGVKIKDAGVVSAESMLPGTAYVKLMWSLGNSDSIEGAKKLFKQNIAGEFVEREEYDVFK